MQCVHGENPNDLEGKHFSGCRTTGFTAWHLKFEILHRRPLIPEWRTVRAQVIDLIESLVVNN